MKAKIVMMVMIFTTKTMTKFQLKQAKSAESMSRTLCVTESSLLILIAT